jgi:hypothetical protein
MLSMNEARARCLLCDIKGQPDDAALGACFQSFKAYLESSHGGLTHTAAAQFEKFAEVCANAKVKHTKVTSSHGR